MRFIFLFLLTISFGCFSQQDMVMIGSNSYKSTGEMTFKCKSYSWSNLNLNIAKNEKTGFAVFYIGVAMNLDLIGGDIVILLDDGSIIKCKTPSSRNYLDERSIAIFPLTETDMINLKNSNIQKIGFSIKNKPKTTSTTAGNYSADNTTHLDTKTLVANLDIN